MRYSFVFSNPKSEDDSNACNDMKRFQCVLGSESKVTIIIQQSSPKFSFAQNARFLHIIKLGKILGVTAAK